MTPASAVEPSVRVSYSVGVPLAVSLTLLRAGERLLPWIFRSRGDYALGFHDPALWAELYVYLLIGGLGPAVVGLITGLSALQREPRDEWAWVGAITSGAFVLVAGQLGLVLMRQGYLGFVLSTLPRFLDL